MFAGHYSASLLAKAASPQTPLWLLLLAAQFVDVLWGLAILGGIERAGLDPALPSNPLVLHDMPWTHSLVGTLVWAGVALLACQRVLGLSFRNSAIVAAVVTSHWFLDLVVHRPDLTLAGGSAKLGLALWDYPVTAWALEVALVTGSIALAMRVCADSTSGRRAWLGLGTGLVVLQTATSFGPLPPSLPAMVALTLPLYFAVAGVGAKVDAA